MKQQHVIRFQQPLLVLAALVLLGLTGLVLYGWMFFGSSILLTLGETGLSWCL